MCTKFGLVTGDIIEMITPVGVIRGMVTLHDFHTKQQSCAIWFGYGKPYIFYTKEDITFLNKHITAICYRLSLDRFRRFLPHSHTHVLLPLVEREDDISWNHPESFYTHVNRFNFVPVNKNNLQLAQNNLSKK